MVKRFFLIFFLFAAVLFAQEISVDASVDSSEYYVGDYIRYTLQIEYPENTDLVIPAFQDSLKDVEFIKELPVNKNSNNGKVFETHTYIFSKYDSAEAEIPAVKVSYVSGEDTMYTYTEPQYFVVRTIDVNPEEDIRDVKAPLKIPFDWLYAVLILAAVMILVAAGYFIYRYYKKKNAPEEVKKVKIVIPPHKIALTSLHELEEKKLWQQGEIKEYHSEITYIIRKYFEDQFNFPALEMPSSEVTEKINSLSGTEKIENITREFFENADMVKFAKFKPMPAVNEEMMKQAYTIVEFTKPNEREGEGNDVQ